MRDVVYPCRGRDPLLQVVHDTIGNCEHVHVTCPAASIRATAVSSGVGAPCRREPAVCQISLELKLHALVHPTRIALGKELRSRQVHIG